MSVFCAASLACNLLEAPAVTAHAQHFMFWCLLRRAGDYFVSDKKAAVGGFLGSGGLRKCPAPHAVTPGRFVLVKPLLARYVEFHHRRPRSYVSSRSRQSCHGEDKLASYLRDRTAGTDGTGSKARCRNRTVAVRKTTATRMLESVSKMAIDIKAEVERAQSRSPNLN